MVHLFFDPMKSMLSKSRALLETVWLCVSTNSTTTIVTQTILVLIDMVALAQYARYKIHEQQAKVNFGSLVIEGGSPGA